MKSIVELYWSTKPWILVLDRVGVGAGRADDDRDGAGAGRAAQRQRDTGHRVRDRRSRCLSV